MYENGSESAENATVIDFAVLILDSVSGARCARAISGSRPAKKRTSREECFTQHLAPCLKKRSEHRARCVVRGWLPHEADYSAGAASLALSARVPMLHCRASPRARVVRASADNIQRGERSLARSR